MQTLQAKFEELFDLLVNHAGQLAQGSGVPFVRLIYPPAEENECRRHTATLLQKLVSAGFQPLEIRCGVYPFKYYQQKGQLELRLQSAERDPQHAIQEMGQRAEQELLKDLLQHAAQAGPNGVLILSETGMLYPFAGLAGVLQGCENQVRIPLVVLYPALYVEDRLLFAGKRETGYYRTRDL